jgi:hypothetical protein
MLPDHIIPLRFRASFPSFPRDLHQTSLFCYTDQYAVKLTDFPQGWEPFFINANVRTSLPVQAAYLWSSI